MTRFIVVYRAHDALMYETRYVGPFASYNDAEDALASLPALGHCPQDANRGVKFIQELEKPSDGQWWVNLAGHIRHFGARKPTLGDLSQMASELGLADSLDFTVWRDRKIVAQVFLGKAAGETR